MICFDFIHGSHIHINTLREAYWMHFKDILINSLNHLWSDEVLSSSVLTLTVPGSYFQQHTWTTNNYDQGTHQQQMGNTYFSRAPLVQQEWSLQSVWSVFRLVFVPWSQVPVQHVCDDWQHHYDSQREGRQHLGRGGTLNLMTKEKNASVNLCLVGLKQDFLPFPGGEREKWAGPGACRLTCQSERGGAPLGEPDDVCVPTLTSVYSLWL